MSRPVEFIICILLGIIALPFFLIGCIIIYATLGRPLFFSQTRAGKGGVPFRLFKLRSMSDARDHTGALLPDEARQTWASAIIRRLRIDEIPQLLLILQGKMALVGPRPLLPETVASFGEAGRRRGLVRPGLTGWAQVSGNTNLDNHEKMQLDLWYVAHRSAALDFRILAETGGTALAGEKRRADRLEEAARWMTEDPARPFVDIPA
ncbi:sugar transferase [Roseivivax sp. THAF40]|nr:sugar transferase [Roseivivax sp. THAF40]